jgi:hypothetical protein
MPLLRLRAGVDVGGTFTDTAIAHDGGIWCGKAPTDHAEVGGDVIASLQSAAQEATLTLSELLGSVGWFALGTTAVTNVIAELKGRRVGLLTTRGFEHELNQWEERFVRLPCRLTVGGEMLGFSFEGADRPVSFFINSQPYIIETQFMPQLIAILAPDLPFNEGVLRPVEIHCPLGSVVRTTPPAPMNSGHIHVAGTAPEAMFRCLRLAIWASRELSDLSPAMGAEGYAALEERCARVITRSYLDPATGDALLVEAVPEGSPRSFGSRPAHWSRCES